MYRITTRTIGSSGSSRLTCHQAGLRLSPLSRSGRTTRPRRKCGDGDGGASEVRIQRVQACEGETSAVWRCRRERRVRGHSTPNLRPRTRPGELYPSFSHRLSGVPSGRATQRIQRGNLDRGERSGTRGRVAVSLPQGPQGLAEALGAGGDLVESRCRVAQPNMAGCPAVG